MPTLVRPRLPRGFSIIELMVAMALGLIVVMALVFPYLSSKATLTRQGQLSALENGIRTAFNFFASDVRMAGHYGCADVSTLRTNIASPDALTSFDVGVEGYTAKQTSTGLALPSSAPANETDPTQWETNTANASPGGVVTNTVPLGTVGGTGAGGALNGVTPGTDILFVRTVTGSRLRLLADANVGTGQDVLQVETPASNTQCAGGTTGVGDFCANSYALITSCTQARAFIIDSVAAGSGGVDQIKLTGTMQADPVYAATTSEVMPLRVAAYYVKASQNGATTSLYRRLFDGTSAAGVEQELIDHVDTMQIRYGVDTSSPADGAIDQYVPAHRVSDWSRVLAIRVSLLMHAADPVSGDLASLLASSATVNGLTVTYATGDRRDHKVFTTTVALRNRLARF